MGVRVLTRWRWAPDPGALAPPAARADWLHALGIAAGVCAIKFTVAHVVFDVSAMATNPWTFGFEVGHIAGNLAAGHGFSISRGPGVYLPTAWVSPLYPMLLAGIFRRFGLYTPAAAQAMLFTNCLLQGATAALLFLLGRRLCSRNVGWIAAAVFLFDPNGWQFVAWAWPSHLFALLLLVHFATLLIPRASPRGTGAAVGATLALAMMTDGAAVAIVPVTLAHFAIAYSGRTRREAALAALVCFAIGVAPWTVRNAVQLGSANPLRGNIGVNLWVGNHPGANAEAFHGLAPSPWHDAAEQKRFAELGERAYDRDARARALAEISAHKGRFVANTLARFSGYWIGEWWTGYAHIGGIYSLGLIALTVFAVRGAVRARALGTGMLLAALLFFGGPYYITVHGHGRYRVPVEPVLCLLAALKASPSTETRAESAEP